MIEPSPGIPLAALAVEEVAQRLEGSHPGTILEWALERYRPRIVLACSFGGPTGMVALDLAMRLDASLPVYFLDTGLLFPETYALIDRVSKRYGIEPIRVAPRWSVSEQNSRLGEALWLRDPDSCCALRKIEPQREFLSGYHAWISGIRRDQSLHRRRTPVAQWDATFGLAKINPLAAWTERDVWAYVSKHRLEYNPLNDAGYPSVGCRPCTSVAQAGGDPRSGRWPGFDKTECGLHQ